MNRRPCFFVPSSAAALALVLGTTVAVDASGAIAATASTGRVTAASLVAAARKAVAEESGVHLEVTVTSGSSDKVTERVLADLAATRGSEVVSEGRAIVTVRVTPQSAYFTGNTSGLTTVFGLSSSQAKTIGRHWVSLGSGTSQYASLKADTTTSSVSDLLPSAKKIKLSRSVSGGIEEYVLSWTTATTSSTPQISTVLTLSEHGRPLPLEVIAVGTDHIKETVKLSKWGEQVVVDAPPARSTIAFSKVSS